MHSIHALIRVLAYSERDRYYGLRSNGAMELEAILDFPLSRNSCTCTTASTSTGSGFLLTEQNENASSTGFLLREFAKVVAVEERDLSNSTDKLIQAADEVRMFSLCKSRGPVIVIINL